MEESERYHPNQLKRFLSRCSFTYANVPYRIKRYEDLLKDPRKTIVFDYALNQEVQRRMNLMGMDGKLVLDREGNPYKANLTEKLLIIILAKLSNYVPEAGIWMNTQRSEWNDANNALAGYGVSMVTLCYLRRFLVFCRRLFEKAETSEVEVSIEVAEFFHRIAETLKGALHLLGATISNRERKVILDELGKAGSDYRMRIYSEGFSGRRIAISVGELINFLNSALRHIDHSIRINKREDGLYHSYNLMKMGESGFFIQRLPGMLEGQVAVMSSGLLSAKESVTLLDSLRRSCLYRTDQNSYLLYPDRRLPKFLEKNNIPPTTLERSKLLMEIVGRGDRRIVVKDIDGGFHFTPFRNSEELRDALRKLGGEEYGDLVKRDEEVIIGMYEELFDHRSFMGRSSSFFKYEGLGCIYWHMVSKLLLAVQEVLIQALHNNEDEDTVKRLKEHYYEIRDGIGVHKSPKLYGAFPTDPHSHTPGFTGAQQPGMTGQVKEDIISRLGEMGVLVEDGRLVFQPRLINQMEFLRIPKTFTYYDLWGQKQDMGLEENAMAFTICQIPVMVNRSGPTRIEIVNADGSRRVVEGLALDTETSSAIFNRTGMVISLNIFLGLKE
ncbi:MAG: hypothetical protein ACUVUS_10070 [Thermoproteota archaeon]